ncbi:hypothetical protein HanRHA438_Chr03g0101261 [Helianthus annuus]|nr:hypothetical protein HanRHA438_Chr03g0101261 [Helianthus annuus]
MKWKSFLFCSTISFVEYLVAFFVWIVEKKQESLNLKGKVVPFHKEFCCGS